MENELTFEVARVIGVVVGGRASRLGGCEIGGADRVSGVRGTGANETSRELKIGLRSECLTTHLGIGSCELGMVISQRIVCFSWLTWLAFTPLDGL